MRGGGGIAGLVFILLFEVLTILLKPKFYYQEAGWEPATMVAEGFYAEPKDSLDVIFLGSSAVFRGVNPLQIFQEQGITGYVFGSSIQRMWISEYYLKEALKYQHPKIVVLEVFKAFDDSYNDENRNRKALDYMRFSKDKIQAVRASIPDDGSEEFWSYIFPMIRYHSRWNQLEVNDFKYFFNDKHFFTKGHDASFLCQAWTDDFENTNPEIPVSTKARESMDRITAICKKNQIRLILMKTPSSGWSKGESDGIKKYAKENQLDFIEYNDFYTDLEISTQTDFQDWAHLNYYGIEKLTRHLGAYLSKQEEFIDKRQDERYQSWFTDYEKYKEEETAYLLKNEWDVEAYKKKLNHKNFLIGVSAVGLEGVHGTVVADNEKVIYENYEPEQEDYWYKQDGVTMQLIKQELSGAVVNDERFRFDQPGYHVVVYDKILEKVIDHCCIRDFANDMVR